MPQSFVYIYFDVWTFVIFIGFVHFSEEKTERAPGIVEFESNSSVKGDHTYVCEVCGEVFIHSFLRGMHARDKYHGWNEIYGCPCYICGEFWESMQMRGQHMRRAHVGDDKFEHARQQCISFLKGLIDQNEKEIEENKQKIEEINKEIDENIQH